MYPIGVLFGLAFDTATEVGLLGIAAVEGTKGLPVYDILLFPLLFTVGMSLLDTTDGILMLGAYGWAYVKPVRKLYYNMTITLVSVLVALLVGTVEVFSVLGGRLAWRRFWDRVGGLSGNFGLLGFAIVGVFAAAWRCRRWSTACAVTTASRSWPHRNAEPAALDACVQAQPERALRRRVQMIVGDAASRPGRGSSRGSREARRVGGVVRCPGRIIVRGVVGWRAQDVERVERQAGPVRQLRRELTVEQRRRARRRAAIFVQHACAEIAHAHARGERRAVERHAERADRR